MTGLNDDRSSEVLLVRRSTGEVGLRRESEKVDSGKRVGLSMCSKNPLLQSGQNKDEYESCR
ncbi:hypothetical protein HanRHA438_Chr08g0344641 [Helianthus annuus]|nr:hypothetical protein HanIR_Chr08g0359901 [Helianthus annuus]KAJ0897340.1 hypothetical protein HanRHA438_Chr08g0344641 [Helianthus annuus]